MTEVSSVLVLLSEVGRAEMTKLTIANARKAMIKPIIAYNTVFLASVTFLASPPEMTYLIPPMINITTATIPTT